MKKPIVKLFTLLLCLSLLMGVCASCGEKSPQGEAPTEAPTQGDGGLTDPDAIDLSDYRIILSSKASSELEAITGELQEAIQYYTGLSVKFSYDDIETSGEGHKEILIGQTNRAQSAATLEKLSGNGFAIENANGTIVINGNVNSVICDGVEYFIQNIVRQKCYAKTLSLANGFSYLSPYQTVELVSNGKTDYTIVYSDSMDDDVNSNSRNNGLDYEVVLAQQLKSILDGMGCNVTLTTDKSSPSQNEILIGKTNRAESAQFFDSMAQTQYGVGYINGKLIVGGNNTAGTALAMERLTAMIEAGHATGNTVKLSLGAVMPRTNTQWVENFPSYDGGKLSGSSESYYNGLMHYITETNLAEYQAYCAKLEGLGYTKTFANEIDGNVFASYDNGKLSIYVYFVPAEKAVRLIVAKADDVIFPQSSTEDYTKVADVSITQLQINYETSSGGMGYVITLEDGSFILIDSSSRETTSQSTNYDHERLWQLLNKLNKRPDGKIIIRGWFMTHEHSDHIQLFMQFCRLYGTQIMVENYYECVVPQSVAFNAHNPEFHVEKGEVKDALDKVNGNTNMVMLHTGMKFSMYGVEFEILYTVEDLYPQTLRYFNNSSTMFRINYQGCQVLITGDIYHEACDVIVPRYTTALKSDIVQVAHHGLKGATKAFYQEVDPTVAFWPTSDLIFDRLISGEDQSDYARIDYYLYSQMHLKESYINGVSKSWVSSYKAYTVELKLPYTLGSAIYHTIQTTTDKNS